MWYKLLKPKSIEAIEFVVGLPTIVHRKIKIKISDTMRKTTFAKPSVKRPLSTRKAIAHAPSGEAKALSIVESSPVTGVRQTQIGGSNVFVIDNKFVVYDGIYKILESNIRNGTNTLLIGHTSVGKTELAFNISKSLGKDIYIFDMGTMLDPVSGLVGIHTIHSNSDKVSESKFIPSRFSEAIQKPGVIILDEITRASLQANNLLFPVLDFRRELSMEYSFGDAKPIKVHPDCVFIATANIGSQYSGTNRMDRALLDRFFLLEVPELTMDCIKFVLEGQYSVSKAKLDKICSIFEKINELHTTYSINFHITLRHLKQIVEKVQQGFSIYDAFYVICQAIGGKEGIVAVQAVLNTSAGASDVKLTYTKEEKAASKAAKI